MSKGRCLIHFTHTLRRLPMRGTTSLFLSAAAHGAAVLAMLTASVGAHAQAWPAKTLT